MVLDAAFLNTQHYKVQIKGKWSNPGKGVPSSATPQCSKYRKGTFRLTSTTVTNITFMCVCVYIYIYIYIYMYSTQLYPVGKGDWGLIPGQVIPKTQKMVLDTSLLSAQH